MKTTLLKSVLFALIAAFAFTGCSDDDDDDNNNQDQGSTLTATLSADARFSILVEALEKTGLDATLDASGDSYTVFAPNNAAFTQLFDNLGVADVDAAIAALGESTVRDILLYHVLNAEVTSSDISDGYVTTLSENGSGNGIDAYLSTMNGVMINNKAEVVDADIAATNGVAHEIDLVLNTPSGQELLAANPDYSNLTSALTLADGNLLATLGDTSSTFTIFAPNNAAFDTLIANTPGVNDLAQLASTLGTDVLANVLLYHVVSGDVRAGDLNANDDVNTLAEDGMGNSLNFTVNLQQSTVVLIDNSANSPDAEVTTANITSANGSVHLINNVLLPQ